MPPKYPTRGAPARTHPLVILFCVWGVLGPCLGYMLWWLVEGERGKVGDGVRLAVAVPLSLPVVFVVGYVSWVGKKFFVHN